MVHEVVIAARSNEKRTWRQGWSREAIVERPLAINSPADLAYTPPLSGPNEVANPVTSERGNHDTCTLSVAANRVNHFLKFPEEFRKKNVIQAGL